MEHSFEIIRDSRSSDIDADMWAASMKKAIWVKPEVVAQIEFLEWTEGDRLRHSKFAGLRED